MVPKLRADVPKSRFYAASMPAAGQPSSTLKVITRAPEGAAVAIIEGDTMMRCRQILETVNVISRCASVCWRKSASIAAIAIVGLVASETAAMSQQACSGRYNFRWGQDRTGSLGTTAGTTCRVRLSMGPRSTISSAQIVRPPSASGSATVSAPYAIVFTAKPGFKGQDSMSVRYIGTGPKGPGQATVTFAISVN